MNKNQSVELVKDIFISSQMSIAEAIRKAEKQLGTDIPPGTVYGYAKRENWQAQREQRLASQSTKARPEQDGIQDMVYKVLDILYRSIMDDWDTKHDIDSAKVNYFINLLSKTKLQEKDGTNERIGVTRRSIQDILAEYKKTKAS